MIEEKIKDLIKYQKLGINDILDILLVLEKERWKAIHGAVYYNLIQYLVREYKFDKRRLIDYLTNSQISLVSVKVLIAIHSLKDIHNVTIYSSQFYKENTFKI